MAVPPMTMQSACYFVVLMVYAQRDWMGSLKSQYHQHCRRAPSTSTVGRPFACFAILSTCQRTPLLQRWLVVISDFHSLLKLRPMQPVVGPPAFHPVSTELAEIFKLLKIKFYRLQS